MGHAGGGGELNPDDPQRVAEERRETTPEQAFEAFCTERYARLVVTVNLIVRDRALAQDIAQEAFARAWLHWHKLWPDGNPAAWVHRVAVNLSIGWRRRAAREARALGRLGRREVVQAGPPEVHPELWQAVAALPHRQRAAVALHYVLGLGVEEVARVMRCRPGTVKSLLHAARAGLRERLGEAP